MNRRRVGVVVLAGLLPWVVVAWPGGWYPIFSAGFLRVETLAFTSLPTYVARVGAFPSHLQAWPIAVLLWAGAVVTAAVDRVDSAVTVGLLALAGPACSRSPSRCPASAASPRFRSERCGSGRPPPSATPTSSLTDDPLFRLRYAFRPRSTP